MRNKRLEQRKELLYHHRSNVEIIIYVCFKVSRSHESFSFLASISIAKHGFDGNEDLPSVSAFGVDLSIDSEPKSRTSLTDEQINSLNIESQQRSLFVNRIDPSRRPTSPSSLTVTTSTYQSPKSITAAVPHQPQLNTTTNIPQNLIDSSKVKTIDPFISKCIVCFSGHHPSGISTKRRR